MADSQTKRSSEATMEVKVPRLAIGLVHYPILDREKKIVSTNVTNFDIHDIARASTVYGVERYYIIHPLLEQLMFVDRILDHWRVGSGSKFNPYRRTALRNVFTAPNLDAAKAHWGQDCFTVATHARPVDGKKLFTCRELHEEIRKPDTKPCFLLFGTGFGMTDEFMKNCDGFLESIRGAPPADYRHLSVRSAVSIYLDRIMGPW
jgi:hypothetical protein